MMRAVLGVAVAIGVSGCAVLEPVGLTPVAEPVSPASDAPETLVRPQARPDQSNAAAKSDQAASEVSTGTLGRTVASLGNAAEPGLWLKTPLVTSERSGRVYYPATNTTVEVTLIPIDGPSTAGSRLSLQAMQALGAPLTGLPEIDVLSG